MKLKAREEKRKRKERGRERNNEKENEQKGIGEPEGDKRKYSRKKGKAKWKEEGERIKAWKIRSTLLRFLTLAKHLKMIGLRLENQALDVLVVTVLICFGDLTSKILPVLIWVNRIWQRVLFYYIIRDLLYIGSGDRLLRPPSCDTKHKALFHTHSLRFLGRVWRNQCLPIRNRHHSTYSCQSVAVVGDDKKNNNKKSLLPY